MPGGGELGVRDVEGGRDGWRKREKGVHEGPTVFDSSNGDSFNKRFHYKGDGTSHILHLSDAKYKFVLFSMLQSNASCKLNSPQKLMKPKDTIGQKVRYYLLIC